MTLYSHRSKRKIAIGIARELWNFKFRVVDSSEWVQWVQWVQQERNPGWGAGALVRWCAGALVRWCAGALGRWGAGALEKRGTISKDQEHWLL